MFCECMDCGHRWEIPKDPQRSQHAGDGQQQIDPRKLDFCRVLYDYVPQLEPGQLPQEGIDLAVDKGELVAVLSKTDPAGAASEWWRCRTRDARVGYLPSPYLEVIERVSARTDLNSDLDFERNIDLPDIDRNIDPSKLDFCRVLLDYAPQVQSGQQPQVTVSKGDLVAILSRTDTAGAASEWWRCRTRDGRIGYLPSTYLELIQRRTQSGEGSNPPSPSHSRANPLTASINSEASLHSNVNGLARDASVGPAGAADSRNESGDESIQQETPAGYGSPSLLAREENRESLVDEQAVQRETSPNPSDIWELESSPRADRHADLEAGRPRRGSGSSEDASDEPSPAHERPYVQGDDGSRYRRQSSLSFLTTAKAQQELAESYMEDGHYQDAIELLQGLVTVLDVLPEDDSVRLRAQYGLAEVYRRDDQFDKAVELLEGVTIRLRTAMGDEHPVYLASQHELGVTYRSNLQNQSCILLLERVVEARRKSPGVTDANTLESMDYLARAYDDEQEYSKAEALRKEIMETRTIMLGEEHPDTLRAMDDLARIYESQELWTEAESMYRKIAERYGRVLGEEEKTLSAVADIATTYMKQQRWQEAEELFLTVIGTMERVFGVGHGLTIHTVRRLASVYVKQGRYDAAAEFFEGLVERRKARLGEDDVVTAEGMTTLAYLYGRQGRRDSCERLIREAMEGKQFDSEEEEKWSRGVYASEAMQLGIAGFTAHLAPRSSTISSSLS